MNFKRNFLHLSESNLWCGPDSFAAGQSFRFVFNLMTGQRLEILLINKCNVATFAGVWLIFLLDSIWLRRRNILCAFVFVVFANVTQQSYELRLSVHRALRSKCTSAIGKHEHYMAFSYPWASSIKHFHYSIFQIITCIDHQTFAQHPFVFHGSV